MKIKFSWGTGIIIASVLFMIFTVITVVTLMNQKVDLVTDNYYEKELKYQDQMDKEHRSKQLSSNVEIIQQNENLNVSFKDSSSADNIKGEIRFYRPSDSAKDFSKSISLNNKGMQEINISGIEKGFWKVQVSWTQNSMDYYFEKPIIIN